LQTKIAEVRNAIAKLPKAFRNFGTPLTNLQLWKCIYNCDAQHWLMPKLGRK